jgi:hypothetical protein
VYHNPSTGMLVLIVSLQLSIVPYAAGPESWCHSMRLYIDVKLLPKSHCSLDSYFHGSQPTHENWYWPSNFNNIFDWKNLKKIYLICLLHTNILAKHKTPPKVKWSSSNIFIINKFHKLRTSTLFKVKKILIMGIEDCFFIRTANHEQLFKTYSLSMTFISRICQQTNFKSYSAVISCYRNVCGFFFCLFLFVCFFWGVGGGWMGYVHLAAPLICPYKGAYIFI